VEKIHNEQYFEYLIDTYKDLVYSICYKIVRDYFEAEDLGQETFISIYKNLHTFDRQNEKAWICRIATNKCLDYLKRAERRIIPTDNDYFTIQKAGEQSPEENILEIEIKKQLYEQCSKLKPPYRDIALDYFYYEMPATEIASKTGKKLKTVQTQIYRAKAMLKKKYIKGVS